MKQIVSETQPLCEKCGRPALVHVTNEIGHEGMVRHYCMECAGRQDQIPRRGDRRLNRGLVLMLLGTFTLTFSLFADQIGFGQSPGFGWKQDITLVLGVVLVGVGTLVRASTLFLMGGIIAVLALLADWLHLGSKRGFGYEQTLGTILGFLFLLAGIVRIMRADDRLK